MALNDPCPIEDTRAAVRALPPGQITDAELARIGVTPEQFADLVDADADRERDEYHSERTESRVQIAQDLTADQAHAIIARAAELDQHAGRCQLDAAQCPTCTDLDHDPHGWQDTEVAAAREYLHDRSEPTTRATGAEPQLGEHHGPDPWRPPATDPASPTHPTTTTAAAADADQLACRAAIAQASAAVQKVAEHHARAAALADDHARRQHLTREDNTDHATDQNAINQDTDLGAEPVLDRAPPPNPQAPCAHRGLDQEQMLARLGPERAAQR